MASGDAADQGSAERIRQAALVGFANEGVEATSIRKVAAAAGVSAGLVQHHFPNKAALKKAVDDHVVQTALEAVAVIPDFKSTADFFRQTGDQITKFVEAEPLAMRYVARSIIDGEEQGLALFDGIVALSDSHVQRLHEEGFFREDIDMLWTGLHLVIWNLACVIFETALDRRLPAPFRSAMMMDRWNRATTELYRHGLDRPEVEK
jgi:AcrR family transcriptional regulator